MIQEITCTELKTLLQANPDKYFLIDVRQPFEQSDGRIEPSILIPLSELPARVAELEEYRNRSIVVYCRSGSRSFQACMYLQACGFDDVANLKGGILRC